MSRIAIFNVVLLFLRQSRIITAVKYKTTCEAFLTENSKITYLIGAQEAVESRKEELQWQYVKSSSLVSCPVLNTVYKSLAAD